MSLRLLAGCLAYSDTRHIAQMSLIQHDPFFAASPSCTVIKLNNYGNSHRNALTTYMEGTFTKSARSSVTFSFLSHTLYRSSPSPSLLNLHFGTISDFSYQPTSSILLYHSHVTVVTGTKPCKLLTISNFKCLYPHIVQGILPSSSPLRVVRQHYLKRHCNRTCDQCEQGPFSVSAL